MSNLSQAISVNHDEIFHHLKLSGQMPAMIEGLVTYKIVAAAAANAGLKVEVAELQQGADDIRVANHLLRVEDTLAWMKKRCLSVDDFEELAHINVLSNKLAHYLFADKVKPYFVEHHLNYAGAVLYEIVLADEDLSMELFYALSSGELSFYDITHQYSQDQELRRSGGYQGLKRRKDLKPEISAAVFAAKPPQVLKPIVTAQGAHLILVEDIIQAQLDEPLYQQILSDLFSEWVKQQLEQVEIIPYLDANPIHPNEQHSNNFEPQPSVQQTVLGG